MMISRDNYEAFLLDRMEGNLSEADELRLQEFLVLNPDCNADLFVEEPIRLEADLANFPYSESLKKELPGAHSKFEKKHFELFSIARLEGDLTPEQLAGHQKAILEDSALAKEWVSWQNAHLNPEQIIFEGKDQLKHYKENKIRHMWYWSISAAAAISLIFILFRQSPVTLVDQLGSQELETFQEALLPEPPGTALIVQNDPVLEVQRDPVSTEEMAESVELENSAAMFLIKEAEPDVVISPEPVVLTQELNIERRKLAFVDPDGSFRKDEIKALELGIIPAGHPGLNMAQLSEVELSDLINDYSEEQDLSIWAIAETGLKGIGKLTGSDISLSTSRDEEGYVSGFKLKSKRISINRKFD